MNKEDIESLNLLASDGRQYVDQQEPSKLNFIYWNGQDEWKIQYNPIKKRIEYFTHIGGLYNMGNSSGLMIYLDTKEELMDLLNKLKPNTNETL
jgi:hypothetical protein